MENAHGIPQKRKRNNSDRGARHIPFVVKEHIKSLYEKNFVYKNQEIGVSFKLPKWKDPGLCRTWEILEYIAMKNELNDLKNNLNDKDMVEWHTHTRDVNLAGSIAPHIRAKFRPELCTQAWCKFYEIASAYLKIDSKSPYFSVHLCEAPGAFVTSLNHYLLSTGYQGNWSWLASTLNPYYEGNSIRQMINDDRFIQCSRGNWYFGVDGTGNLMSVENLRGLREKLGDTKVDLVTADGSIDCQGDPAEQESVVSRLQYCEAITALHMLAPGGVFVVKMFTMFECQSICLMYLLNCVFEQVNVFKPCTSKGGNSEVYVICLGYKGKEVCQSYLALLTELYFAETDPNGCIFDLCDLPPNFLSQHSEGIEFFKDSQMTSIQRNLDLYGDVGEVRRAELDQERQYCLECFLARYPLEPMTGRARIMRGKRMARQTVAQQLDFGDRIRLEGKFTGSYQERQRLARLPWKHKVNQYDTYEAEVNREDNSLWIQSILGPLCEREVQGFTLQTGRPVGCILSSRLCHDFYIARAREVIENAEWLKLHFSTSPEFIDMIARRLLTALSFSIPYQSTGNTAVDTPGTAVHTPGTAVHTPGTAVHTPDTAVHTPGTAVHTPGTAVHTPGTAVDTPGTYNGSNTCGFGESLTAEQCRGNHNESLSRNVEGNIQVEENMICPTNGMEIDRIADSSGNEQTVKDHLAVITTEPDGNLQDRPCGIRCKLKCDCKGHHSQLCQRLQQGMAGDGDTVWLYNIASDTPAGDLELSEQQALCWAVRGILQNCCPGDTVLVELGSCLSRLTAGLVYLLYRSFTEIGFFHHHGNLLRRHLVCVHYIGCPENLLQCLTEACQAVGQSHTEALLEIVPLYTILEDQDFSEFLHISNSNLLQSFITTVIQQERQLYANQ